MVENQASDRAHRIGQTKSVFVYQLTTVDTVEERISELQKSRAERASIAFNETSGGLAFDFADLNFLFGHPPTPKPKPLNLFIRVQVPTKPEDPILS